MFCFIGNCNYFAFSQNAILYTNKSELKSISSELYIYQDNTGKVDIYNILNKQDIVFEKSRHQIPSFSFTNSTIWCKFKIKNLSGIPLQLELAPPILNEVCLYQISNNRIIDSTCSGSLNTNRDDNNYKSSSYIFCLDSLADYYVFKVKSKTRLFIKANIGSFESINYRTSRYYSIHSIYAGMVLMIFLYHLFLFFTTREKIYLFYVLHLLNTAIYFLYMSGFGIAHIWYKIPLINSYFLSVICFGYILTLLFVINFLESRKNLPAIHAIIVGFIVILFLGGMIDLLGYSNIAGKLLNYVGLFVIIPVLIGTVMLWRRGFKPATVFFVAWVLYIFGIATQTMQSLNYIPTNDFTSNAIQIGSSLEIILLAIAVGNKLNFYKKGKLIASSGAKKILMEKDALKINEKVKLEEQYQAQTELLYEKIRELKRQNNEINEKFEEIKKQDQKLQEFHELLETKNKIITKQNDELISHQENLEHLIEERTWELQDATLQAEEADRNKTAFLKDFSHELRTPMNAIAGFSSLLLEIDPEDKSFEYYTSIIVENTDNLLELVDNIIDLSRLQSGEFFLKKIKFDPSKMFIALKEKFQAKLKKEKKSFIELIIDIPPGSLQRVMLDYNRFWKIVYQLLDNSVKYTEAGYIKFGYRRVNGSESIEIFVDDTGIGIKKEKLDIVFESFRKVEKNKLKLYSGTGVGLSLVKGLVKVMEGVLLIDTVSIDDNSDKNTGTTVKVIIPYAFTEGD
jgi:signal transduction histidine kinase